MKAIITGTTGMVGKGVLLECLDSTEVMEVLLINRRPLGLKHSKIKEIILEDFSQLESIEEQLQGYDACFHCMGVSAVGLSEEKYREITFGVTKLLADILYKASPELIFNYVSGAGTDETEKGRMMWARVKGATENYVLNKGFKGSYMFRPGAIVPEKGIKSSTGWYNAFYVISRPLFPLFRKMNSITTSERIGLAMIKTVTETPEISYLENKDINELAKK